MKKIILISLFTLIFSFLNAQDMIVSKTGDVIKGYNLEISESAIFYYVSEDQNSELKRISRNDVLIIQKKDGTKIDPSKEAERVDRGVERKDIKHKAIGAPSATNAERISNINNSHISIGQEHTNKKAMMMMVEYRANPESILETEELSIELNFPFHLLRRSDGSLVEKPLDLVLTKSMWEYSDCGPALLTSIRNKTDQVIFIDLGKSYFIAGGEPHTLYTGAVNTETKSQAVGGGFGLIGVASAKGYAETKVEQRIISIPPMAKITLNGYYFSPGASIQKLMWNVFGCEYPKDIKDRYVGQYSDFGSSDLSSYSVSCIFTYSLDDSFTKETAQLKATFTPRSFLSMGAKILGDYIDMAGFKCGQAFFFPAYQHPYTDIWK